MTLDLIAGCKHSADEPCLYCVIDRLEAHVEALERRLAYLKPGRGLGIRCMATDTPPANCDSGHCPCSGDSGECCECGEEFSP